MHPLTTWVCIIWCWGDPPCEILATSISQCHLEWFLSQFVGVLWINKQCHMAGENNSNIPLQGRFPMNPSPFISRAAEWDIRICEIYRPVNSPGKQQCISIYIYMGGGLLKLHASSNQTPISLEVRLLSWWILFPISANHLYQCLRPKYRVSPPVHMSFKTPQVGTTTPWGLK